MNATNIYPLVETEDDFYIIKFFLPGVGKDNIKVKAEDRTLYINVNDEKKRYTTKFNLDDATASYVDGVLKIKVKRTPIGKEIPIS